MSTPTSTETSSAPKRRKITSHKHLAILNYLAEHPDQKFTPAQVAEATGHTTHETAVALRTMWIRERALRHPNPKRKGSLYQIAPNPTPAPTT